MHLNADQESFILNSLDEIILSVPFDWRYFKVNLAPRKFCLWKAFAPPENELVAVFWVSWKCVNLCNHYILSDYYATVILCQWFRLFTYGHMYIYEWIWLFLAWPNNTQQTSWLLISLLCMSVLFPYMVITSSDYEKGPYMNYVS